MAIASPSASRPRQQFARSWSLVVLLSCGALLPLIGADIAVAQPEDSLQAALALQETIVTSIAQTERSLVAIARVRRGGTQPRGPLELVPGNDGLPPAFQGTAEPTESDFIPHEYATGVVVDRRGLILTNYHALGDVQQCDYYVTTSDRVVYRAHIRAADPWSDMAILRIEADTLEPITLGDGSDIRKGQIVLSMGNPYAIARDGQASASWGIVSNLARKATASTAGGRATNGHPTMHHYGTLIQVDSRLNLGTSGGALVNLRGEMIGLTTSTAALPGHEGNTGYAIPTDEVFTRILNQLKAGREVEYGFLGVLPEELAMNERADGAHGVHVNHVVAGTPAARYGIQRDDLITHVGDTPVHEPDDLILSIGKIPVDNNAQITVVREGHTRSIDVMISKRFVVENRPRVVSESTASCRGMTVEYATAIADFREHSGEIDPEGCIAIIAVARNSPAWEAGLRPLTFVSHVNGRRVERPADFYEVVDQAIGPVQLRLTSRISGSPEITISP